MKVQKLNLRVKIYTLDEVKSRLTSAGMLVSTSITENDEIRKEITDQFVEFVEDSYWHTNYDKENGKIVAQVNRFTAALQIKQWGGEERKDKKDQRDYLVNLNKLLRTQLGLANLDPTGSQQDQYALDPFVETRIKQAMDHDEARACGGTCHSEDPNLAYHIVDLAAVLGAGGYNVASISKQQYEKWKEELKDLLRNQDVGGVRILMQEERDARAATVAAVTAFVSNWNTPGGTRAGILTLKEMLLRQRLIERQIANLKAVNADLYKEVKHRAGDDLGEVEQHTEECVLYDIELATLHPGPELLSLVQNKAEERVADALKRLPQSYGVFASVGLADYREIDFVVYDGESTLACLEVVAGTPEKIEPLELETIRESACLLQEKVKSKAGKCQIAWAIILPDCQPFDLGDIPSQHVIFGRSQDYPRLPLGHHLGSIEGYSRWEKEYNYINYGIQKGSDDKDLQRKSAARPTEIIRLLEEHLTIRERLKDRVFELAQKSSVRDLNAEDKQILKGISELSGEYSDLHSYYDHYRMSIAKRQDLWPQVGEEEVIHEAPGWLREGINRLYDEEAAARKKTVRIIPGKKEEVDKPGRSKTAKALEEMDTLFEETKETTQRSTVTDDLAIAAGVTAAVAGGQSVRGPLTYIPKHLEALKNAKFDEQGPVGDVPTEWVKDMQLDVGEIDNLPDRKLTRKEVREICRDNSKSVLYGYICAMAWGFQGRGPGNAYPKKAWGKRAQFQDRLKNLRGMRNSKRCEAYNLFAGKNHVPGLGPAYFTKLLYFFGPGNHYVMDQWTVKSVCLLTGLKIVRNANGHPSRNNTGFNYDAFCRVVDDLAQRFECTGDVMEQRLFSLGMIKKKPRGKWRQHVFDEWESLELERYKQDAVEQFLADVFTPKERSMKDLADL